MSRLSNEEYIKMFDRHYWMLDCDLDELLFLRYSLEKSEDGTVYYENDEELQKDFNQWLIDNPHLIEKYSEGQ